MQLKFLFLIFFSLQLFATDKIIIREDWAETPPELPVTQKHVTNDKLTLQLHGDSKDKIKKSHHKKIKNDPFYIWSGRTRSVWAVSLKLKEEVAVAGKNLTVKWRTKQYKRTLQLIVQNEEGKWFIYKDGTGESKDWLESRIKIDATNWHEFDIDKLSMGKAVDKLELKSLKAFGFTDLTAGGDSKACSRLDWIELIFD